MSEGRLAQSTQDDSATDTYSFDERTNDFLARIDAKDSRLSISKDYETNSSSSQVHSHHRASTTPPLSRRSFRSHIPVRDTDRNTARSNQSRSSRASREESLPVSPSRGISPNDIGIREEAELKLLHGKLSYPVFQRPRFPGVKRVLGQVALDIQENRVNTVDNIEMEGVKTDDEVDTPKSHRRINDLNRLIGTESHSQMLRQVSSSNHADLVSKIQAKCVLDDSESYDLHSRSSSRSGMQYNHEIADKHLIKVKVDLHNVTENLLSNSNTPRLKSLPPLRGSDTKRSLLDSGDSCHLKSTRLLSPLALDKKSAKMNMLQAYCESPRDVNYRCEVAATYALWSCETDRSLRSESSSNTPKEAPQSLLSNKPEQQKSSTDNAEYIEVNDYSPESKQLIVNPAIQLPVPSQILPDPRRALSEGDFSPRSSIGRSGSDTPSSVYSRPSSSARMRRRASKEKSPSSSISTARSLQESTKSVLNETAAKQCNSAQLSSITNDLDREGDITMDDLESELDKTLKLLNHDPNTGHKNGIQNDDTSIKPEINLSLEELEEELDKTLEDLEREMDLSKILKDSVMNMKIRDDNVAIKMDIDESLGQVQGDTVKMLGEIMGITDISLDIVPYRASKANYDDVYPSYRSMNSSGNSDQSDAVSKLRADIALYTEKTTKSEYINSVSPLRTKGKVNSEKASSSSQSGSTVIIRLRSPRNLSGSSRRPLSTSPIKGHKTLKNVGTSHSRSIHLIPQLDLSVDLEGSEENEVRTKSEELAATFGERTLNRHNYSEELNENDNNIRNNRNSDYTLSVRSAPIIDLEVNDSKYHSKRSLPSNVMYEEVSAPDSPISTHLKEPVMKGSQRKHIDNHVSEIVGVAHDETDNISKLIDHQLQLRASNQQSGHQAQSAIPKTIVLRQATSRDDTNQQPRTIRKEISKSNQQSPTSHQTSLITSEIRHSLNGDSEDSKKQQIKDDIKCRKSKTSRQIHNLLSPVKSDTSKPTKHTTIEFDCIDRDIQTLTSRSSRSAQHLENKSYKQQSHSMEPADLTMSKHESIRSRNTSSPLNCPITVTRLFEARSSRSKNALETQLVGDLPKVVNGLNQTEISGNTNKLKLDLPTSPISKTTNDELADVQTGFVQPVVSQSVRINLKRNLRNTPSEGCSPSLSEPLFRHDVNVFYSKNYERAPSEASPKDSPRCPLENHWFVGQIEGRVNEKVGVHWNRSTQFASQTSAVTTAKAQTNWSGDHEVSPNDVVLLFDEDENVFELAKTKEEIDEEREVAREFNTSPCDSESMVTSFSLSVETVPDDERQCSCFRRFLNTLLFFFFAKRN